MLRLHLRRRHFLCRAWWSVLLLLMVPSVARPNVGPPWSGGHVVAEPIGIVGVAITRETLTVDVRPLPAKDLVEVEAVYHLHNQGPEKKLDLLFASGSENVGTFRVWFGDQPVASAPAPDGTALPESWKPPKQTPELRREGGVGYKPGRITPIAFSLVVPPGAHDLRVCYAAETALYHRGDLTVYRQFAYVLAPARAWSGFGGLDVTIHLPPNWNAACTPTLQREGDTLKGSFDVLPADAIALTVQAPESWAYWPLTYALWGLFALVGLGGIVVCWRRGRSKGRRLALSTATRGNLFSRHAWPTSVGLGLAWGLAVFLAGVIAISGPDGVLARGQASHYGYGGAFAALGVMLLTIVVVPVGFVIAQLTAVLMRRRELARMAPSGR